MLNGNTIDVVVAEQGWQKSKHRGLSMKTNEHGNRQWKEQMNYSGSSGEGKNEGLEDGEGTPLLLPPYWGNGSQMIVTSGLVLKSGHGFFGRGFKEKDQPLASASSAQAARQVVEMNIPVIQSRWKGPALCNLRLALNRIQHPRVQVALTVQSCCYFR